MQRTNTIRTRTLCNALTKAHSPSDRKKKTAWEQTAADGNHSSSLQALMHDIEHLSYVDTVRAICYNLPHLLGVEKMRVGVWLLQDCTDDPDQQEIVLEEGGYDTERVHTLGGSSL